MPHATPAPLTRRLLAALESHAHEDSGPLALAEWRSLSNLFDRELSLLTRLAGAAAAEGAADDPELSSRAALLHERYQKRARLIDESRRALVQEREQLRSSRRKTRAISAAYASR